MQKQNDKRASTPYAWVILSVLFVGLVASFGMRVSFGAYISPWENEFSVNRTVVTSISSLSFIFYAIGQPVTARLNEYFGKSIVPTASILLAGISLLLTSQAGHIWLVYILFGVGFALGVAGCCNVISAAVISNWFVEKRGFAIGLTTSGMAVGQLILVPVNMFMISSLGWRTTMATLSIIIMVVVTPLFIIFLRFRPEEKGLKPYGYVGTDYDKQNSGGKATDTKKKLPLFDVLKEKAFWKLALPYFVCGFTDVGLINTHLIPMAEGKGFPTTGVALAFSLIAVANIAGSIFLGHLSDIFSRRRQLAMIYMFRGATFIILMLIQRPWLLLLFAVLYGVVELATVAPTSSLVVQLFEGYSTGTIIGVVSVSHQLGGAVGSWVPGILYDLTKSYTIVLGFSIILLLGAALLSLRVPE